LLNLLLKSETSIIASKDTDIPWTLQLFEAALEDYSRRNKIPQSIDSGIVIGNVNDPL